jgi:predicted TIM-barrel fold metal-dependent hydrolase
VVVDHQCHWLPPAALDALGGRTRLPRAERTQDGWLLEATEGGRLPVLREISDLDYQLELATSLGIDVLVVSAPPLAEVMHLPGDEAAELLQRLNEELAAAQSASPERVVALASLPLQDPDAALRVLDDAAARGIRGVMVMSSIEGRPIATDETLPVFRRVDELGMPVVLHPAVRSQTLDGSRPSVGEGGIGWMAHTSLAAFNLIESGTLDACPSIEVLHPHLGGVLPYVLGRIQRIQNERKELDIGRYLRERFYTDTVGRTPGQIAFALNTYGEGRVLFGSDHPFEQMAWMKEFVVREGAADKVFPHVLPGLLPAD